MIFIVRHGETKWNLQRKIQGWQNSPLTENGKQQVHNVAKAIQGELKNNHQDIVSYCSDLGRARDSLDIICNTLDISEVYYTRALRERCLGDWEEHRWPEIGLEQQREYHRDRYNYRGHKGESHRELSYRIMQFWNEVFLPKFNNDKHYIIVSHRTTIGTLLSIVFQKGWSHYHNQRPENNEFFVLTDSIGGDFWKIKT